MSLQKIFKHNLNLIPFTYLILIFSEPFMGLFNYINISNINHLKKIQISDFVLLILFILIFLNELRNKFELTKNILDIRLKFFIFFLFIILISSIFNFNNFFDSVLKFLLLFFYYFSSRYYLKISNNFNNEIIIILKFIVYISLACIVFTFLSFLNIYNFNYLIKIYSNFPIFDQFSRLIGPHKPTSKLFATYLFFSILILFLLKSDISKKFFIFSIFVILLTSILTFSRPGLCTVFLIFLYTFGIHKNKYLSILLILIFTFLLLSIGIVHPEINISKLEQQFINTKIIDEYFGWYELPLKYNYTFSVDLFMNTYLILKLIALNSIDVVSFFIGNGVNTYTDYFISQSLNGTISGHYVNSPFPYSQSTFLTLIFEYGIFASISYLIFNLLHFNYKICSSFVFIWIILFLLICFDLDVQHFRFIYIFLPLIYYLLILKNKKFNKNNL